jgi:D-arabinose 1-dehydrogenase-like Zn-dependent alcohol dehydrogenase
MASAPTAKWLSSELAWTPSRCLPQKFSPAANASKGWASGIPTDSEDTLRFAAMTGIRPMIEKFPLGKVNEAYARMTSGQAEFRVVLTM